MKELISSKDVRKYIEEKNWQFSEMEQATMIYQSKVSIPKIHKALSELMKVTDNNVLANQIRERIEWDNSCIGYIQSLAEGFVFHLEIWEQDDEGYLSAGYFGSFRAAEKYAVGCKRARKISVMKLETASEWDEEEWGDFKVASVKYDEQDEITAYWDYEHTEPDYLQFDGRFEEAYVSIPHPFALGNVIKKVGTDEVGIVRVTADPVGYMPKDYSDTYITIELLDKDAAFNHEHVSPLDLEFVDLPADDPRKDLLESAGYLTTGQAYIQEFQMAYEEYLKHYKRSL